MDSLMKAYTTATCGIETRTPQTFVPAFRNTGIGSRPRPIRVEPDKTLYVISDLHIGDGSAKDNLIKGNKAELLKRFLDEVDTHNGRLVILGDFIELMRYRLEDVLGRWRKLFDRIADMDLVYVPGNHDPLFSSRYDRCRTMHPIFKRLHRPFVKTIGDRQFKFMHGHEVDPMVAEGLFRLAPVLRRLTGALEFRSDTCLMTSDEVTDWLLEAGEQILRIWQTLTRQVNQASELMGLSNEKMTAIKRPLRTQNMLARFYQQQQDGLYDVTVTGHTHKAGCFGQWYYNSGCWTRELMNYLVITPDGRIEVRNWTPQGADINSTVIL